MDMNQSDTKCEEIVKYYHLITWRVTTLKFVKNREKGFLVDVLAFFISIKTKACQKCQIAKFD